MVENIDTDLELYFLTINRKQTIHDTCGQESINVSEPALSVIDKIVTDNPKLTFQNTLVATMTAFTYISMNFLYFKNMDRDFASKCLS